MRQFNSTNDWGCRWWHITEQGPWTVWVDSSQISWIRCLGAMWAWPDLHGCTGVARDVAGIGAGAFF